MNFDTVILSTIICGESFGTNFALKRFFVIILVHDTMMDRMIFSSSLCGESLATNVAVKRFFSCMDSDMFFSGILEGKISGILLIFIHIF
jgi:hypothetical protein